MDDDCDRGFPVSRTDRFLPDPPPLFAWRGNGIVLFGEHAEGRWVVTRGWLADDTLTSVRRWTFAAAAPFCGQVRRLVRDATSDDAVARENWLAALAWTEAQVRPTQP